VQAFPVRLPSGVSYWTVLDDDLKVLAEADGYLHQLRFGGDAAESTTELCSCTSPLLPLVRRCWSALGVGGSAGLVHDLAQAHPRRP
jgi:hypothetical protein